ncbi:MAG: inorganic phosphate transporter [Halobacteriaceae archaeon]
MGTSVLLLVGVATAVFVGVNIGGSSTGVAFGPATGSGVLSMRSAGALMAVFAMVGGATVGTHVVRTLGSEFLAPRYFTIGVSIGVLLFTGLGILLGTLLEVSVSTSETAVGSVVGVGAALGVLDWAVVGVVVTWWFVSAVVAFWLGAVSGRYLYHRVVGCVDRSGGRRGPSHGGS